MREETKSNTLYITDKQKTMVDQLEEICQLSSMTTGEYKQCEPLIKELRLAIDNVEDNVRYSG
ncbi:hypothetical protein [Priestia megaterium]|uniref:hypothetical protein n=1 Tax=Priestia megaterium TaxID=1404 RepID=UPI0011267B64|nr:hypothetical protein [Priestia megaterium]TPF18082.1 hypothetical protein CBE78_02310 [Priestia megaterium]TPF22189.1 hypothetical protein CBE79_04815 [Priestia megaterium]